MPALKVKKLLFVYNFSLELSQELQKSIRRAILMTKFADPDNFNIICSKQNLSDYYKKRYSDVCRNIDEFYYACNSFYKENEPVDDEERCKAEFSDDVWCEWQIKTLKEISEWKPNYKIIFFGDTQLIVDTVQENGYTSILIDNNIFNQVKENLHP